MDIPLWVWPTFVGVVVLLLMLDLFAFHRDAHAVSMKEAALTSAGWVALGLSFGVVIWVWQGSTAGGEYFAGYLLEKALAIDNIFVFALLFSYFAVPAELQHRVLFWGVIGALVFRAIFIAVGAALLDQFSWTIYLFGGILVLSAWKMARQDEAAMDAARNPLVRLLRRFVPMTHDYRGPHFVVREAGKWFATPLLAVLVAVETSDIVFAVDSIPAIFSVTDEPFIVFTSNVLAVLGLRALYFLLAGMIGRFHYLKPALAFVLGFVGVKMLLSDVYHVPVGASLLVIALTVGVALVASLRRPAPEITEIHPVPETAETAEIRPVPEKRSTQ